MNRPTLRRRLNTVLLQAFILLVVACSVVLAISYASMRRGVVDDRVLLARTIAHYLDGTISAAIQDLGRLSAELPALDDAQAASRLRLFRFHSPFREATYVVDERGTLLVSDPADTRPIPGVALKQHESVTPLVRKAGSEQRPVLGIVRPFRRDGRSLYLVSEMNPVGSIISGFLQNLGTDPSMRVAVIDHNSTVVAASSERQLFRVLPEPVLYSERIAAHRPLVSEEAPCALAERCEDPAGVLAVLVPLRLAPWGVLIEEDKSKALSTVYTARRGFLLVGLMLAVVGVLVARALSRSVVSPIQQLSRQARTLRAGDLSSPIAVAGDEEIEILASTLNEARERLARTLGELRALNEDLEQQVANRTRVIEARYEDLRLLHAVAQLSSSAREPDEIVPEMLALLARHFGFPQAAITMRAADGTSATYVFPPGAVLPWLTEASAPPAGWERRAIGRHAGVRAELFYPGSGSVDRPVMEALEHQLALSLESAYLWRQTLAQDEQRQVLVRRLLSATEEERRRLARELHDEISQLLTVIQLSLDHVPIDTPDMKNARSLLVQTQKEIHRIIYDLRPSLLDDLGLPAAIKWYADEYLTPRGLNVSLEIEEDLPSRPEIELVTFRIYQEIVTNILRHSRAETVSVELYERDGRLVLAVEDDGVGFDSGAKSTGAGLTGMRERAALVGGLLRIDSEPGMGTHVVLEIPVR